MSVVDDVDGVFAVVSEVQGAKDGLRSGIYDDLHDALRLVLLHRAPDPPHRPLADQVRVPALARPGFADTDTAQRRVDVERVAADALAELAILAVEQVGREAPEVVVRGVRERAAAVAVAPRPDARRAGTPVDRESVV